MEPDEPLSESQRRRRRLEQIISGAADALGVVWEAWRRPDGSIERVDFVNEQVEAMLGYSPEEWRRIPNFWLSIVHPEDRDRAEREMLSIFAGGKGGSSRFRWVGRSGRVVWVESFSVVVRDETGEASGMRGVTMDIAERLAAEERLRYQLSFTGAITANLAEGIYAVDQEGRLTFLNPAGEQMLGFTQQELLGKNPHDQIHHLRLDGTPNPLESCPLMESLRSGSTIRGHEDVFVRKDGSLFPVVCSSSPILSEGDLTGAVLAFQDISDRKRAERLRAVRHRVTQILVEATSLQESAGRILETIGDGLGWDLGVLWLVDRHVKLLRFQASWSKAPDSSRSFEAFCRGMSFPAGSGLPGAVWASGRPAWMPDFSRSAYERSPAAAELGLHGVASFPLRLGDQVVGVIEFFSRAIREPGEDLVDMMTNLGNQIGLYIERKRAEAQTLARNQELQTLLYVISHDLKEPLRGIENFSEMLATRYAGQLEEKGQDFVRRIVRGAGRLRQLLDDILLLSRARQMGPPSEELDGGTLVREALARLEHKIMESGAEVRIAGDLPRLRVDRTWATQALYNLLANALKFTRPGEAAQVEVAGYLPGPEDRKGVGVVVRDRGPGVDPEHLERIFELFQRAVGREVEGTGAGLAIVREVAVRHGGDTWVRPREGGGSEFVIIFGA